MSGREPETPGVRPPAVAGSWYPSDPVHLTSQLEVMLEAADPWEGRGRLRALVAPHAGLVYSGPTAAYGYICVKPGRFDRVLVMSPSHRALLRGAAVDPSTHYETPLGRMPVDADAVAILSSSHEFQTSAHPFAHEHAIEMQLPFLQHRLPEAKLVPVLVGELHGDDFEAVAAALAPLLEERTLVVVSSDFTHYGPNYGYVPFTDQVELRIRNLDRLAIDAIEEHDFERFRSTLERTGATICGRNPLGVLLWLMPRHWKSELRSYTTSGAITGDFRNSVSYASLVFCEGTTEPERLAAEAEKLVNEAAPGAQAPRVAQGLAKSPAGRGVQAAADGGAAAAEAASGPPLLGPDERRLLLRVARLALEGIFSVEREVDLQQVTASAAPHLQHQTAVFVSLHGRHDQRLRGCIGGLEPLHPLVVAVAEAARAAALRDPRFKPLQRDEVDGIDIEISVLGPLVPVRDPEEIVVGRDGVVIGKGWQRGVLLPQVPASQGWDREKFLENVCCKAGLPLQAWKSGAALERFEAQVFSEEDLGVRE